LYPGTPSLVPSTPLGDRRHKDLATLLETGEQGWMGWGGVASGHQGTAGQEEGAVVCTVGDHSGQL
jgi:hypothetical protein